MTQLYELYNSCDFFFFGVPCEFCALRQSFNILFCTVALGPRCSQSFQGHALKEFQENTDAQLRVSSEWAQIKSLVMYAAQC